MNLEFHHFFILVKPGSDENTVIKASSNVKIFTPAKPMSNVLHVVNAADRLSIKHGEEHLIEVMFDDNKSGFSKDFRPDIPLIVRW